MSGGVDCSNLIRTRNSSLAHSAPTLSTSLVSYNATRSLLIFTSVFRFVVVVLSTNHVLTTLASEHTGSQMVRATENDGPGPD